jgi:hypothetical protein
MHTSTEKRSEIVAIKPTAKDTKLNLKWIWTSWD